MKAKYLIRLDDACTTMQREAWDFLGDALEALDIRPIVGVVPDNQDPELIHTVSDADFWDRVRGWNNKGWSIALHGLHHTYHPIIQDELSLLPCHSKSEFVGLPLEQQRLMIRGAWQRFVTEGVRPICFMAPSHTFDLNTLIALETETDIRVIADGYSFSPFRDKGFIWIPQQLWHFRSMPFGVWSICLHPNTMSRHQLETFISDCVRYQGQIIDLKSINPKSVRKRAGLDLIACKVFIAALKIKRRL
jgi:predicted deacetylase